jgi:hypothetical protein
MHVVNKWKELGNNGGEYEENQTESFLFGRLSVDRRDWIPLFPEGNVDYLSIQW